MKKLTQLFLGLLMALSVFCALPVTSLAADPATPKDPANVSAWQTSNTVSIKWDKSEKATGYRIFRKTSKGWKKVVTTKKLEGTVKKLSPATKYTFAVRAYNKCVCGKVTWSEKYATVKITTAPKTVSKVTVNSPKVKWTKVSKADGYELYYKLGSKWVKFAETKDNEGSLKKLLSGVKYNLAVRAYIEADGGRVYSDYKTFTATTALRAPKTKAESPEAGALKIKWSAILGADGYRVYYKLGNGKYKAYKNFSRSGECTIKNLKGGEYTVAVRAFIKDGKKTVYGPYQAVKVTVAPIDLTPDCPHD